VYYQEGGRGWTYIVKGSFVDYPALFYDLLTRKISGDMSRDIQAEPVET